MLKKFAPIALLVFVSGGIILSLPTLLSVTLEYERKSSSLDVPAQFPVTVDPKNKIIVEDTQVNALLEKDHSSFQAAAKNAEQTLWDIFELVATTIADAPWYQGIAAAAGAHERFVTISAGMRKEQAASAFAKALAWDDKQKRAFMTASAHSTLPLAEGSFLPGVYPIKADMTPIEAQALVNDRFSEEILSHYGTTTAEAVPLDQALTIASMIQREAGGRDDMRMISGIIWNRLFTNMNLQIDATVQYAKANNTAVKSWWPKVLPGDIFRKSPYNTYLHAGLPPTPIANPSVAAVLAALNPKKTSCMFYFHDNAGQFHCTDTYAEHVALLKKYFGRGK